MIQNGTYLNVIDNSGAKEVCCIKILKNYRQRTAKIGQTVVVSVKSIRNKNSKIKKGDVVKALIIHTCKTDALKYNYYYTFFENTAVILSKQNKSLGSRIFGMIPSTIRWSKFSRMAASAFGTLK